MSDLKESLFQAIRVIAQAEDSKLTFTKTIEATIFDNSQAPEGIYQAQYQDGVFPAYTDADNKASEKAKVIISKIVIFLIELEFCI